MDSYTYGAADQLTGISDATNGTPFFTATYGRDGLGQVTSDSAAPTGQTAERYTPLDQICYAGSSTTSPCSTPPSGAQAFAYDAADNLTQLGGNTQSFNAAHELCWTLAGTSANACSAPPHGAHTYAYDSRGNRTQVTAGNKTLTTMAYDMADRLTQWSAGSTTATYAYNSDGLRMSKTAGGTTTRYAWDTSGALAMPIGDGGNWYVYGPGGLPIEDVSASTTLWCHHDQLGSTRAVTDSTGAVQGSWQFDAYGNQVAHSGTSAVALLYAGQYKDAESGLYYLRSRYYDPTTGQMLTADPLVGRTLDPYGYAFGDPTNVVDPSGLIGKDRLSADQINALQTGCGAWQLTAICGAAVFCDSADHCRQVVLMLQDQYLATLQGLAEYGHGCTAAGVEWTNSTYIATAQESLKELNVAIHIGEAGVDWYNADATCKSVAAVGGVLLAVFMFWAVDALLEAIAALGAADGAMAVSGSGFAASHAATRAVAGLFFGLAAVADPACGG